MAFNTAWDVHYDLNRSASELHISTVCLRRRASTARGHACMVSLSEQPKSCGRPRIFANIAHGSEARVR